MQIPAAALLSAVADGAGDPDDLGGVAGWAVDVMEQLGAFGAGLLIALENLFPPLPSELILPVAGFAASRGTLSLTGAIAWTTVGSLAGALVLYWLGAALGRDRTFALWQRLPLVDDHDFLRTEAWFARHGRWAVFLGRMIPIFRSLISVPAGVERMSLPLFVLLTTLGSLVWNTTFIVAGYVLGEQWYRVEPVVGWVQRVVILAVVVAAIVWVIKRLRRPPAAPA